MINVTTYARAGPEELRVRDDGCGLGSAVGDGHGILGMRERAMLIGAELTLENREHGGLEVVLRAPLNACE